jgi:hypothetical protein
LPATVPELDLLARIFVRAGRYGMARKCWLAAHDISGGDETFQQTLNVLEDYVLKLRKRKKIKDILAVSGFIFLALFLVFIVIFTT